MNYIIGIDHTGIAVPVLEEALPLYQGLGYEIASGPVIDEDRGIRVCFIRQNQFTIELVSPAYADKKSVIDSFLMSKRGYEIYHICYLVSDLEKQIEIMLKTVIWNCINPRCPGRWEAEKLHICITGR